MMGFRLDDEMRGGGYAVLSPDGRVAVVINQRDPHPVNGQGVTWIEAFTRAQVVVSALNAALDAGTVTP